MRQNSEIRRSLEPDSHSPSLPMPSAAGRCVHSTMLSPERGSLFFRSIPTANAEGLRRIARGGIEKKKKKDREGRHRETSVGRESVASRLRHRRPGPSAFAVGMLRDVLKKKRSARPQMSANITAPTKPLIPSADLLFSGKQLGARRRNTEGVVPILGGTLTTASSSRPWIRRPSPSASTDEKEKAIAQRQQQALRRRLGRIRRVPQRQEGDGTAQARQISAKTKIKITNTADNPITAVG